MTATITIIDDDPAVLDAVGLLLRAKGFAVASYLSAAAFLKSPFIPGCIISDVRMPQMNGLELLRALQHSGDPRPVILLTAHGDVDMAMQAVRSGAFDFIEKPFNQDRLLPAIMDALTLAAERNEASEHLFALRERYEALTERQRETMILLVRGYANKQIAAELGISSRTVEVYRAWAMTKMGAKSLAHLVRMGIELGLV